MSYPVLVSRASELVHRIATEMKSKHGLSSMAVSIYDTSWLAMIPKKTGDSTQWLFPESFTYLLDHQGPDGGWDLLAQSTRTAQYPDSLWIPDCIVHSLAGLLALCRHFRPAESAGEANLPPPDDGLSRIFRAKRFLDSKLAALALDGITHFGFELLVPVLLRLLEEEGVQFDFPAKEELSLKYEEASSIDMAWLYDGPCKVPLFCLEAFLGKLDFNRLSHLVTSTAGIAASPASTAAYLVHSEVWSDEAEEYLRHAVLHGQGAGDGSVGGVFPLEIFEPSWVLTALLENGFTAENLGLKEVDLILEMIHESLEDGVTGATHAFFPDADDTSRALMTLNLQGYHKSPSGLLRRFEVDQCFETFDHQLPNRVTSVSVNGNVLNALLHSPDPNALSPQIEKVARFLCKKWGPTETLQDHWNMSEYYGIMHIAQSLIPLLIAHDRGSLMSLPADLFRDIVPSTLQQVLGHLLSRQHPDGSWGTLHCSEETAYAVVALVNLGCHPAVVGEKECAVDLAIARGKQFLLGNWVAGNQKNPDRVWTGKVLHGLAYVGEAYILAALKVNRVNLAGARGIHFN
ncbi:terpenoid cyclases/protein prenyltransferase alpha-alpha toroid [Aspergillus egyptiacus]|nr:terpenoid cyclases/protein prenyltransferase alpha-alpha toroid [Aspergillus egyptiacus]